MLNYLNRRIRSHTLWIMRIMSSKLPRFRKLGIVCREVWNVIDRIWPLILVRALPELPLVEWEWFLPHLNTIGRRKLDSRLRGNDVDAESEDGKMSCEHEDEFDCDEALERLDTARPTRGLSDEIARQTAVSADVQARALVAVVRSLRRIESHLCDKGGGGTPAG